MDQQDDNSFGKNGNGLSVVTPFAGHPAATLTGQERDCQAYGLQANCTELVGELAQTMHSALEYCQPHGLSAAAKACMRGYLCEPDLLNDEQKQGGRETFRRHLLYAAPDRSFSILAIVWKPGQHTPVHGHTAWGAAGVYEGNPYCETYTTYEASPKVLDFRPGITLRLHPGDIATVEPGLDDAHRIGNDTISRCITIHLYGRDLLANPGSINIVVSP